MLKKIWDTFVFVLPYKKLHSYYKGIVIKTRYNKYYFDYTDSMNIKYYTKCRDICHIKKVIDVLIK